MFRRSRGRRRIEPRAAPVQRIDLAIGEIGARGDGIGDADGRRIFVPLTAPGDVAVVDARGERGVLVGLTAESPHRAPAPCPHYGQCGGCALQHVSAEFYRDWKRERVCEALLRADLEAPVAALVATPAPSRRRATFAVKRSKAGVILGFNARQSAEAAPVPDCRILHPELAAALPALGALASVIPARSFDLAVTLCRNGLDVNIGEWDADLSLPVVKDRATTMRDARCVRLSLDGEPLITFMAPLIDFDGIVVTPPPGGFLQASKEGEAALLGLVSEAVAGAKKVADLFAGCGSFALPLAKSASVFAVDADARAVSALASAAANAQREGKIKPVRSEARDLFERPLQARELNAFDVVVFDPPRAGAAAQAEELAKSTVTTVVGVSCNPVSFARDAHILSQGGYRLVKVTPVDQFVYSPHVELVGEFRR